MNYSKKYNGKKMEQNCATCFEEIDKSIRCSNPECSISICYPCFEMYININLKESNIPKCISKNCGIHYVLKNFKREEQFYEKYIECCIKYLMLSSEDKIQKKINMKNEIENIRKDRNIFIENRFPKAISYTANRFFKKKMIELEKSIRKKIEEEDQKLQRKCMRIVCNGYIDDKFFCKTCLTQFCEKCEKIKNKNHECKKENIESINYIKNMIRCPKCSVGIEKSEGCDLMRCTNCKTNFTYSDGKFGGMGNSHNENLNEKIRTSLCAEFMDYLNQNKIYDKMNHLENLSKKKPKKVLLNKFLASYMKGDHSKEIQKKIALQHQRYVFDKFLYMKHKKIINDCEDLINMNILNEERIDIFINNYEYLNTLIGKK